MNLQKKIAKKQMWSPTLARNKSIQLARSAPKEISERLFRRQKTVKVVKSAPKSQFLPDNFKEQIRILEKRIISEKLAKEDVKTLLSLYQVSSYITKYLDGC